MKTFLVIPLAIALAAALGWIICAAIGIDPHPREMVFSAVAICAGSELAMLPMIFVRGQNQANVSQAALISSAIHMLGCAGLGGSMYLIKSLGMGNSLTLWLGVFYLVTLMILLAGLIHAIKVASPATNAPPHA